MQKGQSFEVFSWESGDRNMHIASCAT